MAVFSGSNTNPSAQSFRNTLLFLHSKYRSHCSGCANSPSGSGHWKSISWARAECSTRVTMSHNLPPLISRIFKFILFLIWPLNMLDIASKFIQLCSLLHGQFHVPKVTITFHDIFLFVCPLFVGYGRGQKLTFFFNVWPASFRIQMSVARFNLKFVVAHGGQSRP